ncbi:MAG TPA: hypothetical protein DCZ94_10245 [Lentisphaeria bacterium]|nr:MAG: hypothetical protein A2X48_11120 [Lentisphaerae bacterium GWF2_49_21]HBC87324.1 hypothetical protein [Lentisphaeria bacterium]
MNNTFTMFFLFLFGIALFSDGVIAYLRGQELGLFGNGGNGRLGPLGVKAEMIAGALLIIIIVAMSIAAQGKKKENKEKI